VGIVAKRPTRSPRYIWEDDDPERQTHVFVRIRAKSSGKKWTFWPAEQILWKKHCPRKLAQKSRLRPKITRLDFRLTGKPLGNTIQLQSFGGCDSVETDSPIEHHPGRTGDKMLTLRGEHF
jgi:hypothetical protein